MHVEGTRDVNSHAGRPGGGSAKEIKPRKVWRFNNWQGGSSSATSMGGCGGVLKLGKSERKTSQLRRQLSWTIGKGSKRALLPVYMGKKSCIIGQNPQSTRNRRRHLPPLMGRGG